MPPVRMTREEYQRMYGVAPVLPSTSNLDTTPAPRRMTMAEYQAEYGKPEKVSGFRQAINSTKEFYGGGEFGIANKLKEDIKAGAADMQKPGLFNKVKGVAKTGFRVAGDVAGAVFQPIGAAIQMFPGAQRAQEYISKEGFEQKGGLVDSISNIPAVQRFATKHPIMAGEDFQRGLNLVIGREANAPISPKTMIPRTIEGAKSGVAKVQGFQAQRKAAKDVKVTQSIADEIANIENNYSKLRKNNEFSKDADASRRRIAEADVLADSVDKTGTISTKNAVEAYRKKTIDGMEGVVRENLARLGEKVNLAKVERDLSIEIANSGLEGADLITALNGVKKEIAGLKLRADEFGDILLEKVHDAKISTTRNIDFNTPPETKTYRKAVARAYKTIVEENSSFNVGEVNKELSKYYEDISRLEALEGRKVRGGKLGKYTAQIAGNIAGGAVGGALGGLPGAAVGTIVGGETASFIKGKNMAGTFGKERGLEVPKNEILEKAKAEGKLPPEKDLKTPSPKVGAPKAIKKTKEIYKLENDIRNNVEAQKKAISKGDFTLVAKLKEIYDHLVAKLKEVIKKIKETPNKEGGFVRLGSSTKDGKGSSSQSQQKQSSGNDTTKGADVYKGEKDLTTKILKDLEGKTTVSKQYILDATNRGELKQVERDLIRQALETEGDVVKVPDFAKKVKAELLPLKTATQINPRYESISLPSELRGNVKNYSENVYESPIKTSAGETHFPSYSNSSKRAGTDSSQNYFGHTRIEDMADNKTRRVIEVQSDLYQKGNLEREAENIRKGLLDDKGILRKESEISKLQQYNDPTAHFRMVREEIKKAAQDGKTKLQFPTGETAMKIEGLGDTGYWLDTATEYRIEPNQLRVGMQVQQGRDGLGQGGDWIITDVLGDGKFKAVPKNVDEAIKAWKLVEDKLPNGGVVKLAVNGKTGASFRIHADETYKSVVEEQVGNAIRNNAEQFDISGKVDTNNPIYKFYEKDVQKYLNKFGGKKVVDDKGVSWIEVPIKKEWAKMPVEAFAILATLGLGNDNGTK